MVMPPLSPTSPAPEIKRCTVIFEFQDKEQPDSKGWGWGCECDGETFVDPTDDIDLINITGKKILWKSE